MIRTYFTVFATLFFFLTFPKIAHAAISDWQKGASVVPNSTTDFSSQSFKQSLQNLKSTNSNYVSLIITYYQDNLNSTNIYAGWNTPTDQSLVDAVNYAHSLGLKVMFKFHSESQTGQWRAYIDPSDRRLWFGNYTNIVNHYADIAQNNGVEAICIGTELYDLTSPNYNSSNTGYWNTLIGSLRSHYSGQLTYSAQHTYPSEENEIQFWDKLDYIGISAYFPLDVYNSNPSVDSIKTAWDNINNSVIYPLSQRWHKSVVFTEIGYRSVSGAHFEPSNPFRPGAFDDAEQARDYQALYSYWDSKPYMAGLQWWNWSSNPNAGGPGDTGFTPQNKQAQMVMTQMNGTNTPAASTSFNFTANIPPSLTGGNQNQIAVTVSPSSPTSDISLDFEIFDSANHRVFQQIYEHQNLSQSQNYSFNWTPPGAGTFVLESGAFTGNWSANYTWNSHLADLVVGQAGPTSSIPGDYSVTAAILPSAPAINTPSVLVVYITSPTAISDAVIDMEISNGTAVINQQYLEHQNLAANQQKSFSFNWTPAMSGAMKVSVGIFSANWTNLYRWTGSALTFNVSADSSSQPVSSTSLNIWWPTDGSSISGSQPFKAQLANTPLTSYQIYWQVDGGQMNLMLDSNQDAPHKEALVDVSSWNWRGTGPYTVNFIAKNSNGITLAQNSISLNVIR